MLAGYLYVANARRRQPQAAGARSVREKVPQHNDLSTIRLQSLIHQLDVAAWQPKVGLYNLNDGPMISSPRVPCLSRRSPATEREGETTLHARSEYMLPEMIKTELRSRPARRSGQRSCEPTCPEVCRSQHKGVTGCAAMRTEAATVPPEVDPHARCLTL
ncbi:hypothetical protein WOLCODRAFT_167427 [Wolfiporia cocos MD-104 SS10]|uniref:Uncharacterized protein n=1 Tax=Wolfiporia cocos (strain MD-104) TaxID=742152 RepID=A0A2H3JHW2_WOLCO|nr:hypothetical protein WOLCODRAFT_167427 [Wolfiporia cocos MD-104 SS10]